MKGGCQIYIAVGNLLHASLQLPLGLGLVCAKVQGINTLPRPLGRKERESTKERGGKEGKWQEEGMRTPKQAYKVQDMQIQEEGGMDELS